MSSEPGPAPKAPHIFHCQSLLRHARSDVRKSAGIAVVNDRIVEVAGFAQLRAQYPLSGVTELNGLVFPGFIDAHTHLRGIPLTSQGVEDAALEIWLLRLGAATQLNISDEAAVAGADALSTAVTTLQAIHHTYSGLNQYQAEIDSVARGLTECGIRAVIGLGITDQSEHLPPALTDRVDPVLQGYKAPRYALNADQYSQLVSSIYGRTRYDCSSDLLSFCVAPVGPQWCSDALLRSVSRLSVLHPGVRVHTHLLESRFQRNWLPSEDPVSRLRRFGLLLRSMSVAHGVWLNDAELSLLGATGVSIVHCPTSNASLQVGDAPVSNWIDSGICPALGTDGRSATEGPDFFDEMRAALRCSQRIGQGLTSRQVLEMATDGGAVALGRSSDLGRLEPGYKADFGCVAVSNHGRCEDVVEELVSCGTRGTVSTVVVGGRVVVSEGRHVASSRIDLRRHRLLAQALNDEPSRLRRLREARTDERTLERYLQMLDAQMSKA